MSVLCFDPEPLFNGIFGDVVVNLSESDWISRDSDSLTDYTSSDIKVGDLGILTIVFITSVESYSILTDSDSSINLGFYSSEKLSSSISYLYI